MVCLDLPGAGKFPSGKYPDQKYCAGGHERKKDHDSKGTSEHREVLRREDSLDGVRVDGCGTANQQERAKPVATDLPRGDSDFLGFRDGDSQRQLFEMLGARYNGND